MREVRYQGQEDIRQAIAESLRRRVTIHFVRALYRWFTRVKDSEWVAHEHVRFALTYLQELKELHEEETAHYN